MLVSFLLLFLLYRRSFVLKLLLLAGCGPKNGMRGVVFTVSATYAPFELTHSTSARNRSHIIYLSVITDAFKIPSNLPALQMDCNGMSSLTDCPVMEFTIDAHQLSFSRLYRRHVERNNGPIRSVLTSFQTSSTRLYAESWKIAINM